MTRILVAICCAALLASVAVPAEALMTDTESAAVKGKKGKKKAKKPRKCKRGQVRVKVLKRVRCQPLKAALPRPRAVDQRLVMLKSALGWDWSRARDRRGRRAPSTQKLFGRVGPGAYRATQRVLPRALRLLDRVSGSRVRAAAAPCGTGPKPPGKDIGSFSERGPNGLSLEVKVGIDSLEATVEGKDRRIDMAFDLCKVAQSIEVPQCPTSQGVVEARSVTQARIAITLLEDGKALQTVATAIEGRTDVRGEVADDAKLDTIVVDDVLELKLSSPGGLFIGDAHVNGWFKRHARVDMRSRPERYQPEDTATILSASLGGIAGLLVGDQFRQNATRQLKQSADQMFADTIARAIAKYRERETDWNNPNACVDVRLNPGSGTLRLRQGANGSFTAKLSSKRDGGSPSGDWRLSEQRAASFSPTSARAEEPSFAYVGTRAGGGIKVSAKLRATSKGGVGEATWVQDTEEDEEALYFKVLAASYREDLLGQENDPQSGCGLSGVQTSFSETNTVSLGEQPFNPVNRLDVGPDGSAQGQISAIGAGTASGTFNGCDIGQAPPWPPCTQPIDGEMFGGPALFVSIPAESTTATVSWPMPNLGITFPNEGTPTCVGGPFRTAGDPNPLPTETYPASIFRDATAPTTLTFHRFREGNAAAHVHISSTVDFSITFQRVRADGSPL